MATDLDVQCRSIIETSYPLFVIHTNHVTTLPDTTLFALCEQIYATARAELFPSSATHVPSLRDVLAATFDSDHRAFVLDDTSSPDTQRILAALDVDSRGCLFAQAIAGIIHLLRSVAACRPSLSEEAIAARLQRFAEGEERRAMLAAVETSPVWSDCFEKAQIGRVIMRATGLGTDGSETPVERGEVKKDVAAAAAAAATVSVVEVDDIYNEPAFNDGPHPDRNLGVPDVFTIMALN